MINSRKQSFLEHLTGSRKISHEDIVEDEDDIQKDTRTPIQSQKFEVDPEEEAVDEVEEEDEEIPGLAVDMFESDNELVLQCMVAGVTPENLHISITRSTVTIEGKRIEPQGISDDQYVTRELYWGQFLREIELPFEIDPDGADAVEKYGLLIIRLPKFNVTKIQELKVKSI